MKVTPSEIIVDGPGIYEGTGTKSNTFIATSRKLSDDSVIIGKEGAGNTLDVTLDASWTGFAEGKGATNINTVKLTSNGNYDFNATGINNSAKFEITNEGSDAISMRNLETDSVTINHLSTDNTTKLVWNRDNNATDSAATITVENGSTDAGIMFLDTGHLTDMTMNINGSISFDENTNFNVKKGISLNLTQEDGQDCKFTFLQGFSSSSLDVHGGGQDVEIGHIGRHYLGIREQHDLTINVDDVSSFYNRQLNHHGDLNANFVSDGEIVFEEIHVHDAPTHYSSTGCSRDKLWVTEFDTNDSVFNLGKGQDILNLESFIVSKRNEVVRIDLGADTDPDTLNIGLLEADPPDLQAIFKVTNFGDGDTIQFAELYNPNSSVPPIPNVLLTPDTFENADAATTALGAFGIENIGTITLDNWQNGDDTSENALIKTDTSAYLINGNILVEIDNFTDAIA